MTPDVPALQHDVSLDALDALGLTAGLDGEASMVQASVARFVDAEVLPVIGECFEAQRFPRELVPGLAALGLLGCALEGHGCAGLGPVAHGLVCQELERGDSALRSFVSVQGSLVMHPIHAWGAAEQQARWLPVLARGEAIGCFALTEPDAGSDPARMRTRARRAGGDWLIDGAKMWISNGTLADVTLLWAQTSDGIRGFLVERGTPGFTAVPVRGKMSLRASDTAALHLDGVRVPDAARLPGITGLREALQTLNEARYGISWGAIGSAMACLREALDHARGRMLFGRPLAATQLAQARLADMTRRLATAQLLAMHLATLKRDGRLQPAQVSLAKWNNVRMALDIARDCRELLGAAGITTAHVAIRHLLNLESVVTYEGTEAVHQLVIGRALTGHSAF